MGKPKSQSANRTSKKISSGAVGGPATAHGVSYQLKYAVYRALALISEGLAVPYLNETLTIEPRAVHEQGITKWDVGLGTGGVYIELKANATRADATEFLSRLAAVPAKESTSYLLVYGDTIGTTLTSIRSLRRLAIEADNDPERFTALCVREDIKEAQSILNILGPNAQHQLRCCELQHFPEHALDEQLRLRAQALSPEHHERLVSELSQEFLAGMQTRRPYAIRQLIRELEGKGIAFSRPTHPDLSALPDEARKALLLLSHASSGLPVEVVADAVGRPAEAVMQPLVAAGIVASADDRFHLLMNPITLAAPEAAAAITNGLAALLNYIKQHEGDMRGRALVRDAVQFTRLAFEHDHKAAVPVYRTLEKLLKRIGNKHLVLELAELTIAAARRGSRDIDDAKAEAHALICGKSWAYQRLGLLEDARLMAKRSLDLGADIGWERNTAFCLKCTGRIVRLQAEKESDNGTRKTLLDTSAQTIDDAIHHFQTMSEIGPTHPEVGDCYSLLARTYLVAKQYDRARDALRKAYELIPLNGSKDHLDLLILTGDLQASTGDREAAEDTYTQALDLPDAADVQQSEIFARGYQQRGRNRERLSQKDRARSDYECASKIWLELEEFEHAAAAQWAALTVSGEIEKDLAERLGSESSHLVRVTAFKLYRDRYSHVSHAVLGRRKELPKQQIEQLLREAHRDVAIRYPMP